MYDGQDPVWNATLALRVSANAGRSVCRHQHHGPLRLLKPLYPEGPTICHAVLIHPPGGIAGGDALELAVDVEPGAHALVTTPGAAKWYKANGRRASQQIRLAVHGMLEWLPQESIVFNAADVRSAIDIELGPDAGMIGWDIVALGRHAAGERFNAGLYSQSIRLSCDGQLAWHERTRIIGDDPLLTAAAGLGDEHVFGCLWAAGAAIEGLDLEMLREELGEHAAPVTRFGPRLLVARARAGATAQVRASLTTIWAALRPRLCGTTARPPRLWAT
jgi:urease accessory protein